MNKRSMLALCFWVVLGLATSVGCVMKQKPASSGASNREAWSWSLDDARRTLEAAANSTDPSLRAQALPVLASGAASWLERGWLDPSPTVQRSMAISHALSLSKEHLTRPGADRLAVAWAVLERKKGGLADQEWQRGLPQDVLVSALLGDVDSIADLLSDVRDGMVPPEPMMVDILAQSGIEGVGAALAEGAIQAEEEMRLPLALVAHRIAPLEGAHALLQVLGEADELTKIFALETITEQAGDRAHAWLRTAAKGEQGALREHARIGLVALGNAPIDDAIQRLGSVDRDQRVWAATCLMMASNNRPLPRTAILALQGAWRDESIAVRLASTRALIAGAGIASVPMEPTSFGTDLDAVAVMVAAKWYLFHQGKASFVE